MMKWIDDQVATSNFNPSDAELSRSFNPTEGVDFLGGGYAAGRSGDAPPQSPEHAPSSAVGALKPWGGWWASQSPACSRHREPSGDADIELYFAAASDPDSGLESLSWCVGSFPGSCDIAPASSHVRRGPARPASKPLSPLGTEAPTSARR